MKTSDEMVNSLLERRDAYAAQQRKTRKTVMRITSVACSFALVALLGVGLWQGGVFDPATPPVEEPDATTPTTEPTEDNASHTGGDDESCTVHSLRYHSIPSNFRDYDIATWVESVGDNDEGINIVNFVEYYNIPREEFIELMKWNVEELDELMDDEDGHRYCPYTYNQFLDAIYGDDAELTAWVFASESTWPEMKETEE